MTIPPQPISPGNAVGGQASSAGGTTGQPSQGSVPAQVTATVTNATSPQVAAALAKLPVETLLQASIQSQSGNQLTLATALGQVTVKLPTQLPTSLGDLIWARLPTSNAATQSSGAGSPADALRLQLLPQTLTSGASGAGGSLAAGNIGATTLTPGQTFNAVTTTILTMPNGTQLPAGSQTQVIFLGQGTVTAQQASNVLNAATGAPGSVPGGAGPTAGITPTIAAQTTAGQPAPTLLLTGTVLPPDSAEARMLPQGYTALRTSAGIVGIKLPVPAPTGATLSFSVNATASGRVAPTGMPMTEAELIARGHNAALTHDWDSLQKAVSALQQHDPGAAMTLLNNLPQPGPKLTTAMMFFFAAMTGQRGSLRGWIGDRAANSLSSLSDADGGGLKRLEGDFGQLRAMAADERPDGWRVMAMPFNMGGKVEQLQLGWRHGDRDNDPDKKDDQGTRFLLDLSFSGVGHTQLDGLVKGEDSKFDLIIRTENPLQSHNRDDIRGIFREALQISGYKGHIQFQDGSRFVQIAPPGHRSGPNSHHGIEA